MRSATAEDMLIFCIPSYATVTSLYEQYLKRNRKKQTTKKNNNNKTITTKNATKVDQHDYTVIKVTMRTSKVVRTCFQTFCICIYTINLCSKQINVYIAWTFLSNT